MLEMNEKITFEPIGWVHSPFNELQNMPIQPTGDKAAPAFIEIQACYMEGLKDLEAFSHIMLIYHFHKSDRVELLVKPFLDNEKHGVFATRTPVRPNHIGFSMVEIDYIQGNRIYVKKIDILNKTPILDIKPYVPEFDLPRSEVRIGWYEPNVNQVSSKISDERFL